MLSWIELCACMQTNQRSVFGLELSNRLCPKESPRDRKVDILGFLRRRLKNS